jgi:hypothetical protein
MMLGKLGEFETVSKITPIKRDNSTTHWSGLIKALSFKPIRRLEAHHPLLLVDWFAHQLHHHTIQVLEV